MHNHLLVISRIDASFPQGLVKHCDRHQNIGCQYRLITANEEGVWRMIDLESKEASSEDEPKLDRRHLTSDLRCALSLRLCPGFPDT